MMSSFMFTAAQGPGYGPFQDGRGRIGDVPVPNGDG